VSGDGLYDVDVTVIMSGQQIVMPFVGVAAPDRLAAMEHVLAALQTVLDEGMVFEVVRIDLGDGPRPILNPRTSSCMDESEHDPHVLPDGDQCPGAGV
jgi:hypothetical protein